LLGPAGAGKTALLRVLLGLDARARGEVTVLGLDPGRDPLGVRRAAGYVPERPALYASMTAFTLGRFVADLYPTWDARRYVDHLARLGVPPRVRAADLPPAEAARLALAVALGHGPRLLVVDVPHDLDALGRHQLLLGLEDEAAADPGLTVLLATSRPLEAERLAGHVVVLAAGEVRHAGPLPALRARHRRLEVGRAEHPPLPDGARVRRWRPGTARRPGELLVEVDHDDAAAGLAALPGVSAVLPATLDDVFLALVCSTAAGDEAGRGGARAGSK
ncbi:MAG: ATP-binding cassette domain-containing protein, partial [Planctomycetes bacterium]|nr:ATP-binding cassette domain-containing protein [Planctomycetota bacterium]